MSHKLRWIVLTTWLTFITIRTADAGSVPAERPNIVFIMSDDQDYWHLQCYGDSTSHTPHLNALAQSGAVFTRAQAVCPQCGPARVNVLTGQYLSRFTPYPANDKAEFPLGTPQVVEMLNNAGYHTGFTGKTHFRITDGGVNNADAEAIVTALEFDEIGFAHKYALLTETDSCHFLTQAGNFEFAYDFLGRNKDSTFALFIWHTISHGPWDTYPENYGDSVAAFGGTSKDAMNAWLDDSIGGLMHVLDSLGLRENTLLIYTTDNASTPELSNVDYDQRQAGNKSTVIEEYLPFIASWPGQIDSGIVIDDIIQNIDYLPTFMELAGTPVDNDPTIDGTSFAPLLFGNTCPRPDYFVMEFGHGRAITLWPWKFITLHQLDMLSYTFSRQVEYLGDQVNLLFNLESDPLQHVNLIDSTDESVSPNVIYTDAQYVDIVDSLRQILAWHQQTFDYDYGEYTDTTIFPPKVTTDTEVAQPSVGVVQQTLRVDAPAEYRVYSVSGKRVAVVNGSFNGRQVDLGKLRQGLSNGIYFYRVVWAGPEQVGRFAVVR
jgi:arylsulfatase A-like enzyme